MNTIRPKKSLGQNFLQDENILKKIVSSFSPNEQDLIIEIGAGKGALTKYLVTKNCNLICYEIDTRMKPFLTNYESDKCIIIYDDILKRNLKKDIESYESVYVIANIPYYITTPIIEHLLASEIPIKGMTLLVQKEVGERFTAKPKTKDYGYFTVFLNHYFNIEKICDVSPKSFSPPPKVSSSVIKFTKKETITNIDISKFSTFLKRCFKYKRKTLKNNLTKEEWEKINLNPNTRAEDLSYEEFVEIYQKLV